jgi:hypothetical protein
MFRSYAAPRAAIVTLVALTLTSRVLPSQTPSWYRFHNQVAPTVTASVSLNAGGNFVYSYTVANGAAAAQRINLFLLELAQPAFGANAPTDWTSLTGPTSATWLASGTIEPSWTEEHELDIPSFTSEIAAGTSRTGFELISTCASSTTPVPFYIQGYNHLGKQPDDDTSQVVDIPNWREDAIAGTTVGPSDCSAVADWGNRRPGVDGFVGVVNFANGATLPAGPVTVQVRFARDGETVNTSTFSAELNSTTVTGAFVTNGRGDKVAVFTPGSSALRSGKNVLLLKVDGLKAGTTQTATDADRFTFTIP